MSRGFRDMGFFLSKSLHLAGGSFKRVLCDRVVSSRVPHSIVFCVIEWDLAGGPGLPVRGAPCLAVFETWGFSSRSLFHLAGGSFNRVLCDRVVSSWTTDSHRLKVPNPAQCIETSLRRKRG
jgi:hypothetical protein